MCMLSRLTSFTFTSIQIIRCANAHYCSFFKIFIKISISSSESWVQKFSTEKILLLKLLLWGIFFIAQRIFDGKNCITFSLHELILRIGFLEAGFYSEAFIVMYLPIGICTLIFKGTQGTMKVQCNYPLCLMLISFVNIVQLKC